MNHITFKDLEDWQKIHIVQNLRDGESVYYQYTTEDLLKGYKEENKRLKEHIKHLERSLFRRKNLIISLQKRVGNWEDLKKWLEKKKKDDKYHYNSLERLATYDLVLDKMIGLEGRDK